MCERIGRSFARSYPPIQPEDIAQELAVFLAEKLEGLLARVGPESREGYVYVALQRRAVRYCQKELADLTRFTDQYSYRPDDVRAALAAFLLGERPPFPDDYVQGAPPRAGLRNKKRWRSEYVGNDLALLADVLEGWNRLTETERELLRDYLTRDTPLESSARNRASRAVDRLTALMNDAGRTRPDGPGTALGNRDAIDLTAYQETGRAW
jgi:hypothetical protein